MKSCMIPVIGLFVLFMALITGNVELSAVVDFVFDVFRELTVGNDG